MAREGLTQIIADLRLKTDTSVGDVVVNSISYWTDDQLQEILDNHAVEVYDLELIRDRRQYDGEYETRRYFIPEGFHLFWELPTETLNRFDVVDSQGTSIAWDAFTFYPNRRLLEFPTDQGVNRYFLRAFSFNMNSAAADVWERKAGLRAELVDWKAGSMQLKEDQEYQHCKDRAAYFQRQSGFKAVRMKKIGYVHGS